MKGNNQKASFVPFEVPLDQQIPEGVSSEVEDKVEDSVDPPRPASALEPRSTSYMSTGGPEELTVVVPAAMQSPSIRRIKVLIFVVVLALLCVSDYIHAPLWVVALCSAAVMLAMDVAMVVKERASVPMFLGQVKGRMPWSIGPFVICMFLMVRALTGTGFTGRFSQWMVAPGGTSPFT